jgi:hypothetical protein
MRATVFVIAGLTMLIARVAVAQPAPWAPERLTPGWVFTPSAVVGVLHDSNVTLRAVNEPITSEAVGLLNPRGEVDFNGRRTHFNLGYSGALEAYRELSELNRYEQHGRLELRHQARPHLQLFTTASFSSVPTTDRLELGPGVLPFIGIGSQHFETSAGFHLQVSPRTKVDGGLSFQTIHFDRQEPDSPDQLTRFLRDGHSVSPNVTAMYDLAKHVSVGAAWSYRHAVVSEGLNVVDVQSTTAELGWQAAEHTTIRGGVGAAHLTSDTELVSRWGPAYHLGVEHNEGRVELSARYEHAFVPSIGFGGLSADQRFSSSVKVPLAKGRWVVGGNVGYGQIEPVDLLGIDYTLNSLWTQGTVGYQVSRWLRAEGFYNRSHQTSTARGLVDRTRVGIEFVTAKPVRIQ